MKILQLITLVSLLTLGVALPASAAPQSRFNLQILPMECVFEIVNDGSNQVIYLTPEECGVVYPPPDGGGDTGTGGGGGIVTGPRNTTDAFFGQTLDTPSSPRTTFTPRVTYPVSPIDTHGNSRDFDQTTPSVWWWVVLAFFGVVICVWLLSKRKGNL